MINPEGAAPLMVVASGLNLDTLQGDGNNNLMETKYSNFANNISVTR